MGIAIAGMLLGVGLAALLLAHEPARKTKFVAFYATDLPGDLERLRVRIVGVTIGVSAHPLRVEQPVIDLSELHGPEGSRRIASGNIPIDAAGDVSVVFGGAEGLREGQWFALEVPQNRLTLGDVLKPERVERSAVLFDFDLEKSLSADDTGKLAFQPYVGTAYQVQYRDEEKGEVELGGSGVNWSRALGSASVGRVESPAQVMDSVARNAFPGGTLGPGQDAMDQISQPGSRDGGAENGEAGGVATPESGAPDGSAGEKVPDGYIPDPVQGPGGAMSPPVAPHNPSPADGALGVAFSPILSWSGGGAEAGRVVYDVFLNGLAVCDGIEVAQCRIVNLSPNSTHKWWVVSTDAAGQWRASESWTFTTSALTARPNHAPPVPELVGPSHGSTGLDPSSITLAWVGADSDGDEVEFVVALSTASPANAVQCGWNQSASCSAIGLLHATTYYWTVTTRDSRGAVTAGPEWSFTTANRAPRVPTNPTPLNGQQDQDVNRQGAVTLSWQGGDPDDQPVQYRVWFDTNPSPITVQCFWTPSEACGTPSLRSNQTYYWKVEAKDSEGWISIGPVWSFHTTNLEEGSAAPDPSRPAGVVANPRSTVPVPGR